jgi:hypothetical protein
MKRSILTLAIALGFSFTATPADALLTEGQKCAMKAPSRRISPNQGNSDAAARTPAWAS